MRSNVVLVEHLCQLTVPVLHSMSLVNDHIFPLNLTEKRFVFHNIVVSSYEDIELAGSVIKEKIIYANLATYTS